jgi:hypothetical protein
MIFVSMWVLRLQIKLTHRVLSEIADARQAFWTTLPNGASRISSHPILYNLQAPEDADFMQPAEPA